MLIYSMTYQYIKIHKTNKKKKSATKTLAYKNMALLGQKLFAHTCYTAIILYCKSYVSLFSLTFSSTFSSLLIPPFYHYFYCQQCLCLFLPAPLSPFIMTPFSCYSWYVPSFSFLLSLTFSVLTLSTIYFLPTSHLSLPPHFIIPSLYWCSCRNETWL